MSKLKLADLPMPPLHYRIDRAKSAKGDDVGFETRAMSNAEDAKRRSGLLAAVHQLNGSEVDIALNLAQGLGDGLKDGDPPPTLASSAYMRDLRIKVIGNVWALCDQFPPVDLAFVTLMPRGLMVEAGEISGVDPRRFIKCLRNDLDRAGVTQVAGMMWAGLDCEFDATRGVYDFHFHCMVAGAKVEALEGLRKRWRYRQHTPKIDPLEAGLKPKRRVQIMRGPLSNMPMPIAYCVKSAIYHRPTIPTEIGGMVRAERCRRLPEPHHSRWLMWLDQWSVDDMTLRSGMRVIKQGLELIR